MVKIPANVAIRSSIRPGSVYYFAEETFNSEEPHYFIVLNIDPTTDIVIILACIQTNIINVKKLRSSCPIETLFEISPEQYEYLKHISIIDCNRVIPKSIEALIDKLEKGDLKLRGELSIDIIETLRKGVLLSDQIEEYIQEILR